MKQALLIIMVLTVIAGNVNAAVVTKEVSYKEGDTVLKGYMAWDDSIKDRRPGVLVVHEWWGHNTYARKRARMLAEEGFTALAVDMYGDGKTADHPDTAGKFSGMVMGNMPMMKARFIAAENYLKAQPTVDKNKIAAIGYCFGGAVVLNMARAGHDIDAVVSFHGSLGAKIPAKKGNIKAEVLVMNGADDPFVKPEAISEFKQEMRDANANYRFINYPGAKHSFTNPEADSFAKKFNLPLEYNAEVDKQSWREMLELFGKVFR
ncbi:MAG: dienelactone hydrolase family protein [Gammaproteobacteria bacterium]|nr:dienelactone hydrolase family protein [Gammaproteobacteria bacterium]MDH5614345.1 dienelactone hydrolase family protein [Gammaproteobacteria bacterium]